MDKVLVELSERAEREKLMTEYVLNADTELEVRVCAIEYPSENTDNAVVAFEIYAKCSRTEERIQRIALIRKEVPGGGKEKQNSSQAITVAAQSMFKDFASMQGTLSTKHLR